MLLERVINGFARYSYGIDLPQEVLRNAAIQEIEQLVAEILTLCVVWSIIDSQYQVEVNVDVKQTERYSLVSPRAREHFPSA